MMGMITHAHDYHFFLNLTRILSTLPTLSLHYRKGLEKKITNLAASSPQSRSLLALSPFFGLMN